MYAAAACCLLICAQLANVKLILPLDSVQDYYDGYSVGQAKLEV